MMPAELRALEGGGFAVSGSLDYQTVPAVLRQARELLPADTPVHIDLGAVRNSDSAGVALLVRWLRDSRGRGQAIHFTQVPEQMRAIAHVSGLDPILQDALAATD